MARIVECVPNFSVGQDKEACTAIANAISATEGCHVLDVDPGVSTNRTVYTFIGSPDAVVEGALNGARAAASLIDMTRHTGEHPRLGALDVCPFIPVKHVTMEECVECAREFGERLAAEIGVPVFLYGEASAKGDHRVTVPQIRAGEYESLPEKLADVEKWKPDFGPSDFVPNWGATIVGARKFLLAYNVNMLATKEQAHRVALNIREQGRGKDQPGRLKAVQAIGWYLEEANMAQVSVNITDYEVTAMHEVYEEIVKDAKELNLAVCGSQIVGLVPLDAVLKAAEYYEKQEKLFLLEEDQRIRLVADRMGLHSLGPFKPKEKIVDYMLGEERDGPLMSLEVKDFVMTVGSRSPAPGGGSVSALVATLGAALSTMTGFLTYGNRKFHSLDGQMRGLLRPLYQAIKDLIPYVDADAAAFNDYMLAKGLFEEFYAGEEEEEKAAKLPHKDPEEEQFREEALQRALANTVSVPMSVALTVNALWPHLLELAKIANIQCKSDLQVGAKCLETGVWGCYQNVLINLKDIKEEQFREKVKEDAGRELKTAEENCKQVLQIIEEREK